MPGAGDDLVVRQVALGRGAYVRGRLALLMAVAATHDAEGRVRLDPQRHGGLRGRIRLRSRSGRGDVSLVAQRRRPARCRLSDVRPEQRRSVSGVRSCSGTPIGSVSCWRRRPSNHRGRHRCGGLERPAGHGVDPPGTQRAGGRVRGRSEFGRVRTARAPGAAQATGWHAGVAAADRADVGRSPPQRSSSRWVAADGDRSRASCGVRGRTGRIRRHGPRVGHCARRRRRCGERRRHRALVDRPARGSAAGA